MHHFDTPSFKLKDCDEEDIFYIVTFDMWRGN